MEMKQVNMKSACYSTQMQPLSFIWTWIYIYENCMFDDLLNCSENMKMFNCKKVGLDLAIYKLGFQKKRKSWYVSSSFSTPRIALKSPLNSPQNFEELYWILCSIGQFFFACIWACKSQAKFVISFPNVLTAYNELSVNSQLYVLCRF